MMYSSISKMARSSEAIVSARAACAFSCVWRGRGEHEEMKRERRKRVRVKRMFFKWKCAHL